MGKRDELYSQCAGQVYKLLDGQQEVTEKTIEAIIYKIVKCTQAIIKKSKPKPRENYSDIRRVFAAYSVAYETVHTCNTPYFNTQNSSLCRRLIEYLEGNVDTAVALVEFYLTLHDSWYFTNHHPLRILVDNYQSIDNRRRTGKHMSDEQAKRQERAANSATAMTNYVRGKS